MAVSAASDTSTATVSLPDALAAAVSTVDGATVTVNTVVENSSNAIVLVVDTQEKMQVVESSTAAVAAIDSATVAINDAHVAIQAAETATVTAALDIQAVDSQTAVVAIATTVLDSSTAVLAEVTAAVDSQTVVVATDTANLSNAQAAADASVVTVTTNGITATVYNGTGSSPALPSNNTTPILTTTVPQIAFNWGNGSVMGGPSDRVIVKFEGTITVPNEAVAVKYAVSSDDGSLMYIDGQLAINNWRDQGTAWSPYSPTYNTAVDKQQDFVIWYYENGGGATCTLGWLIWRADGSGYFTTPGASAFGTTTVIQDPALVQAAIDAVTTLNTDSAVLVTLQENKTNAEAVVATDTQTKAAAISLLSQLTDTATATVTTAADLANVAATKANDAKIALDSAVSIVTQVVTQYVDAQLQAQKDAEAAAAAAAQSPAAAPTPVDQPADPAPAPAPAPSPAPDAPGTPSPEPAPAPAPSSPADSPAVPADPQPAPAPSTNPTKDSSATPGLVPNNPNSLPDSIPKLPDESNLIAHVQVDKPGVENGGIEFFGTKTQPQVVGEDGKLTPPPPPPGSGLPIPPDAITLSDTFIGQPGGTTFNAPDVAVPVIETPVTGALAAVPGVQTLNHAFVAMANIGNDMSPITRKKAKKILVLTTVIAAVRRRFN